MEYKYKIVKDPVKTFMINKFTAYNQRFIVSETLQNGNIVVAWVDDRESGNYSNGALYDIYFAIINKDGIQINSEDIRANKDGVDTQSWPDISALPNGNFMIVWNDSRTYVKAGIFYPDGRPLRDSNNNDFKISPNDSTADGNYQNMPKVAVINDNRVMVTYQKSHNWALGGLLKGIILDLDGNIKIDAFQISQFFDSNPSGISGFSKWHDTTSLCSGLVATTWMFDNNNNVPTNPGLHDLYIQIYNANGSPQLAIKELQAVGKIDELWPKIIASENCEAVVTWSEPSGFDHYYNMYMKRIKYDSISASINVLVEKTKAASHYGINSDYSPVINNYNQDILLTYASGPLTNIYSIFFDKNLNQVSNRLLLNPSNELSDIEVFYRKDEEILFYNSFAQAVVQNQLVFFTSLSSVPWGGEVISQTFNILPFKDTDLHNNILGYKCTVIPKTSDSDVITSLINLGDAFAFSYQKGNPLDVYLGKLTKNMMLQKELRMNFFAANDQGGASSIFFEDENVKNQGTIVSIWTSYGQSNPSWWSGYAGVINLQTDLMNQVQTDLLVTSSVANSVTMAKLSNNRFVVSDHTGCSATECGHLLAHIYSKSGVLERDIEVYNGAAESSGYPGYGVGEYRVFSLKDGKFGGIWHVKNHDTLTGYVSLQLFSANGDKFGSVIRITDNIEGYKEKSFVAALSDGGFVVVYQIHDQIRGYLFDNFGNKRGSEIIFSEPTNAINMKPFAFGLNEGNFIVYWQQSYDQNQNYRITAKLYTNNGIELLKEFYLDSDTESGQKLGSDSFVVSNLLTQLDDGSVAIAYANATAIKICNVDLSILDKFDPRTQKLYNPFESRIVSNNSTVCLSMQEQCAVKQNILKSYEGKYNKNTQAVHNTSTTGTYIKAFERPVSISLPIGLHPTDQCVDPSKIYNPTSERVIPLNLPVGASPTDLCVAPTKVYDPTTEKIVAINLPVGLNPSDICTTSDRVFDPNIKKLADKALPVGSASTDVCVPPARTFDPSIMGTYILAGYKAVAKNLDVGINPTDLCVSPTKIYDPSTVNLVPKNLPIGTKTTDICVDPSQTYDPVHFGLYDKISQAVHTLSSTGTYSLATQIIVAKGLPVCTVTQICSIPNSCFDPSIEGKYNLHTQNIYNTATEDKHNLLTQGVYNIDTMGIYYKSKDKVVQKDLDVCESGQKCAAPSKILATHEDKYDTREAKTVKLNWPTAKTSTEVCVPKNSTFDIVHKKIVDKSAIFVETEPSTSNYALLFGKDDIEDVFTVPNIEGRTVIGGFQFDHDKIDLSQIRDIKSFSDIEFLHDTTSTELVIGVNRYVVLEAFTGKLSGKNFVFATDSHSWFPGFDNTSDYVAAIVGGVVASMIVVSGCWIYNKYRQEQVIPTGINLAAALEQIIGDAVDKVSVSGDLD